MPVERTRPHLPATSDTPDAIIFIAEGLPGNRGLTFRQYYALDALDLVNVRVNGEEIDDLTWFDRWSADTSPGKGTFQAYIQTLIDNATPRPAVQAQTKSAGIPPLAIVIGGAVLLVMAFGGSKSRRRARR